MPDSASLPAHGARGHTEGPRPALHSRERNIDADSDLVKAANSLSHADFHGTLILPCLTSPRAKLPCSLTLRFEFANTLDASQFDQCFELIRETSAAAYRASSRGWHPADKRAEMREPDMRYLMVLDSSKVAAFLSFMVTDEDDIEVVYCYEVHVSPVYQRKGIGAVLMQLLEAVGQRAGMEKAMLTVFTSNADAIRFYERIGYTLYDEEAMPPARKLRSRVAGKQNWKPSYIIMAKDL